MRQHRGNNVRNCKRAWSNLVDSLPILVVWPQSAPALAVHHRVCAADPAVHKYVDIPQPLLGLWPVGQDTRNTYFGLTWFICFCCAPFSKESARAAVGNGTSQAASRSW